MQGQRNLKSPFPTEASQSTLLPLDRVYPCLGGCTTSGVNGGQDWAMNQLA